MVAVDALAFQFPSVRASNAGTPTAFRPQLDMYMQGIARHHQSTLGSTAAARPSLFTELETKLEKHFDRVMQEHLHDPRVSRDSGASSSAGDAPDLCAAFEREHGISPQKLLTVVQAVVTDTVHDYTRLFAAETKVFGDAEHCDRVRQWLRCTDAEFDSSANARQQLEPIANERVENILQDTSFSDEMRGLKQTIRKVKFNQQLVRGVSRLAGGEKQCKICFAGTANVALIPCGHALCDACAKKVSACPYCNLAFCTTQPLFYM